MKAALCVAGVVVTCALALGCGGDDSAPADTTDAGACVATERATEDMKVSNDYGNLSGTLELPAGCGPFPTALILAGSGATDRDGNTVGEGGVDTLKMLAEAFAEHGIASARYDKGGVAKSRGAAPLREEDMTIEEYIDDAKRWVEAMRQDPRIGPVIVVGHSEGAFIGMMAAKQLAVEGYVSLAGPGRDGATIVREQLARQTSDAALLAKIDHVLAELKAGRTVAVDDLPDAVAELFRPSVQPYLITWFKYDPAEEIRTLTAPTLLAQGTTDIQISVEDAQRLGAAKPDASLVIIDEMMHELKHATLDNDSQLRAYSDPSLPLVPELVDRSVEFVANR